VRIGVVGGLDRRARDLETQAMAGGHQLELHTGVLSGPASAAGLRALVGRSDLVVILTEINSHNAVRMARRHALQQHRPIKILRRLGPSQLAALMQALPARSPAAAGELHLS
jgi:hypothetical protein